MARPTFSPQSSGRSTPSTMSSTTNSNWPTSLTSYPISMASDDNSGKQGLRYKPALRAPQDSPSQSRPPNMKQLPNVGAACAGKTAGSRGKLHKRSNSVSSEKTPKTSAFPAFDPDFSNLISPPIAYQDAYVPPSPSASTRSKVKIKPLLRKLNLPEKTSLDLSRSAAENEGLGIHTASSNAGRYRDGSDGVYNRNGGGKGYHTRTTSGTSQVSTTTTSSNHRTGAHYVHPMRQSPCPYTPPVAHSYQNSLENSEVSSIRPGVITEDNLLQFSVGHTAFSNAPAPYAPLPSAKRTPPPLHIRTHSSSRLTSPSQTNLPGTPSSLRYTENSSFPLDTMPMTTRSSFESAFRKRSRTNTNTDPVAQMVAVQALRAEFNAREAAKDLKIQQAEARAQEKDARRKDKHKESVRRKSEATERKRAKSNAASEKSTTLSNGEYISHAARPMDTDERPIMSRPKARGRSATAESAGKAGKAVSSGWSLFWFQFKTVWLKFKRTLSSKGKTTSRPR